MAGVDEMDQLVDDDVVEETRGGLDDPPVEAQHARRVAGGPALLLAADQEASRASKTGARSSLPSPGFSADYLEVEGLFQLAAGRRLLRSGNFTAFGATGWIRVRSMVS